jgi:heme exporter protein A
VTTVLADDPQDRALPPLLRCRGLCFGYAGEPLLDGIDLDLLPGQALLLVGANGSGKSTLLRLLAGLMAPDRGSVERATEAAGGAVALAWLGHVLGLKPGLTVAENLRFAVGLHGHGGRVSPAQALASVGLDGFDPVPLRELSAGQRKRVALARLLLLPAPLWLLDEPYANLDPDGCRLVDRLVDRHLRAGGSAVLSLHRADQAGFDGAAARLDLGVGA